jgi:hypothetical protein
LCLVHPAFLGLALALLEGPAELVGLQRENLSLLRARLLLLGELPALQVEHFRLVADFLGLLEERAARVPGGDDGEGGEDRGGHGGELGREDERLAEA